MNPRQWGGLGPMGAFAPCLKKNPYSRVNLEETTVAQFVQKKFHLFQGTKVSLPFIQLAITHTSLSWAIWLNSLRLPNSLLKYVIHVLSTYALVTSVALTLRWRDQNFVLHTFSTHTTYPTILYDLTALVASGDEHDVAEHFWYSCLLLSATAGHRHPLLI